MGLYQQIQAAKICPYTNATQKEAVFQVVNESQASDLAEDLKKSEPSRRDPWVVPVILFGLDQTEVRKEYYQLLDQLVLRLNTEPDLCISIQGHADESGSETYNLEISEQRALSVAAYLLEKDISAGRFFIKGYGETRPRLVGNSDFASRLNRRVEILPVPEGARPEGMSFIPGTGQ